VGRDKGLIESDEEGKTTIFRHIAQKWPGPIVVAIRLCSGISCLNVNFSTSKSDQHCQLLLLLLLLFYLLLFLLAWHLCLLLAHFAVDVDVDVAVAAVMYAMIFLRCQQDLKWWNKEEQWRPGLHGHAWGSYFFNYFIVVSCVCVLCVLNVE